MIYVWKDENGANIGTAWYAAFGTDVVAEASAQTPIPRSCKLGNLRVTVETAGTGDIVTVFRLVINGTETDVFARLAPGSTTAECLNRFVNVSQGDRLSLKGVTTGTAGSSYLWARISCEAVDFGPVRRVDT